MRFRLVLFFLISCLYSIAQNSVDVDKNDRITAAMFTSVGGEPFVNTKFYRLTDGSPYYIEDWSLANVVLPKGTVIKNTKIKLDLYHSQVHYLDSLGREMVSSTPIKELEVQYMGNVHRFVNSTFLNTKNNMKGWYELLYESRPVTVYKYYHKDLNESKPYGSATIEQQIVTTVSYVFSYNNKLFEVKKLKDIPSNLDTGNDAVEAYIKSLNSGSLEDKIIATAKYIAASSAK